MLVDIIYILVGSVINIIYMLLRSINFIIPDAISNSLTTLFAYLTYFEGVFPVYETLKVLGFLFSFSAIWYTGRLIMKLFGLMPWIGKKTTLNTPTKSV